MENINAVQMLKRKDTTFFYYANLLLLYMLHFYFLEFLYQVALGWCKYHLFYKYKYENNWAHIKIILLCELAFELLV